MSHAEETCQHCKYFVATDVSSRSRGSRGESGFCARYPPKAIATGHYNETVRSFWPEVFEKSFCGEFIEKGYAATSSVPDNT